LKEVGFKPGVKERERGVMGVQNGETEEEEVTGEVVGESEMEKLTNTQTPVETLPPGLSSTWIAIIILAYRIALFPISFNDLQGNYVHLLVTYLTAVCRTDVM